MKLAFVQPQAVGVRSMRARGLPHDERTDALTILCFRSLEEGRAASRASQAVNLTASQGARPASACELIDSCWK